MKAWLLIVITVTVIGCKPDNQPKQNAVSEAKVNKPAIIQHHDEVCDTDFDTFFKKFSVDSVFQKKHIKFPLKNSYLDNDYNKFVRNDITEAAYRFMDFESHKNGMKQEYDKYSIEIIKRKDSVGYLMKGYDNGIMITITFSFIDGCWYLVEIEDAST